MIGSSIFFGTESAAAGFGAGFGGGFPTWASIPESSIRSMTSRFWTRANGCQATASRSIDPDTGGTSMRKPRSSKRLPRRPENSVTSSGVRGLSMMETTSLPPVSVPSTNRTRRITSRRCAPTPIPTHFSTRSPSERFGAWIAAVLIGRARSQYGPESCSRVRSHGRRRCARARPARASGCRRRSLARG